MGGEVASETYYIPSLTLYQVAETLDPVLVPFHHLQRDGVRLLATILDCLQGRATHNTAAALTSRCSGQLPKINECETVPNSCGMLTPV